MMADNRVGLALFLVGNLLVELLGGAVSDSAVGRWLQDPLAIIGYLVAALGLLVLLVGQGGRLWHGRAARRDRKLNQSRSTSGTRAPSRTRHLAERVTHWGSSLAGDAATEAVGWFRAEEPSLRRLLAEQARAEDPLPDQVVEDLAAIAGSLETWYVRRQQLDELTSVNESLRQIASRAGRPDLEQLAGLRAAMTHRLRGGLGAARAELEYAKEVAERTPRHPHAAALEARQHHEWALIHLAEAKHHPADQKAAAEERENAARALEAGWAHLPRADIPGEITTLVNLAAVALHQERPKLEARRRDPAAVEHPPGGPEHGRLPSIPDNLGLAEALARAERDLTGFAHVIELRGVAAWRDDQHRLAVKCWRDARNRYAELGLAEGQARCLQHLGSAIVVVPEVAGLLRDNEWVALDEDATKDEARSWLKCSKALREKLPHADTELVDYYLDRVEQHGWVPFLRRRTDTLRPVARRFVARVRWWWKGLS